MGEARTLVRSVPASMKFPVNFCCLPHLLMGLFFGSPDGVLVKTKRSGKVNLKLTIGRPIFFGARGGLYSIFSVLATNFGNLGQNVGAFQSSSGESFGMSPHISRPHSRKVEMILLICPYWKFDVWQKARNRAKKCS